MKTAAAINALGNMKQTPFVKRMLAVVRATGKVPTWIENEIRFDKVATPKLEGNASGNAALSEDTRYHGGYVE